jgi:hypothetical protein
VRLATSQFRGSKNLSVDMFALRNDDAASGEIDNAYGFLVDYPNDLWSANLGFKRIGDGFKPAMGFAPRTGIRKATLAIAFAPRPGHFGIRQLAFEQESEVITNLDGRVDNWQVRLVPLSIRTDSGEEFEYSVQPTFERLVEPFEISDGVIIPAGSYRWTEHEVEASTASKRRSVMAFEYRWANFYGGNVQLNFRRRHARPSLDGQYNLAKAVHAGPAVRAGVIDVPVHPPPFRTGVDVPPDPGAEDAVDPEGRWLPTPVIISAEDAPGRLLDEQHANGLSIQRRVCRGLLRVHGVLDDGSVRDLHPRRRRPVIDDPPLPEPAVGLPVDDDDRVRPGNEDEGQYRAVFRSRGAQARRKLLPPRQGAVAQEPPIPDCAVDAVVRDVHGVVRAEHRLGTG